MRLYEDYFGVIRFFEKRNKRLQRFCIATCGKNDGRALTASNLYIRIDGMRSVKIALITASVIFSSYLIYKVERLMAEDALV